MAYTFAQLAHIWMENGGDPKAAPVAAAIALAESGGNPLATNRANSNGSVDRGLWQINSVHGALSTYDINANARAAIQISNNGKDWNPWTTYWSPKGNPAYRQFLNASNVQSIGLDIGGMLGGLANGPDILHVPSPFTPDPKDPTQAGGLSIPGLDALSSFAQALEAFHQWISNRHNILRVVQGILGVSLIVVGLIILNRDLIEGAVNTATKVAETAALA